MGAALGGRFPRPAQALDAQDLVATPTALVAFETPWDGTGSGGARQVYAAASSASAGWTGAALYAETGGALAPLGGSGSRRSVIGQTVTPLPPSFAVRLDRSATVDVELASEDFVLANATPEGLASGANRAMIGGEVLQFAQAERLGDALWRLRGLLRGRGGTEAAALAGQTAGMPFVLLDDRPIAIDPARLEAATSIAAIGLADAEPVSVPILHPGLSLQPLVPVHPRIRSDGAGGLVLDWTRRARGAWTWPDGAETPLNEQAEAYVVGLGDTDQPALRWQPGEALLALSAASLAQLAAEHAGKPLWVRQAGSFAQSEPLLLMVV